MDGTQLAVLVIALLVTVPAAGYLFLARRSKRVVVANAARARIVDLIATDGEIIGLIRSGTRLDLLSAGEGQAGLRLERDVRGATGFSLKVEPRVSAGPPPGTEAATGDASFDAVFSVTSSDAARAGLVLAPGLRARFLTSARYRLSVSDGLVRLEREGLPERDELISLLKIVSAVALLAG